MRAPIYLSDTAAITFAPARDERGAGVVVVSWHQGSLEIDWTEQMELTAKDVVQLRDFCAAWLLVHGPEAA